MSVLQGAQQKEKGPFRWPKNISGLGIDIITAIEAEFMQKLSAERATYQAMLRRVN